MATQIVPVMRVSVDANPRGSATKHVTMPSANPYERETVTLRDGNNPRSMLPGLGAEDQFGFDFSNMSSQYSDYQAAPSGTPAPAVEPASGGFFDSMWSGISSIGQQVLPSILQVGTQVGTTALQNELNKPPSTRVDPNLTAMQMLIAAQQAQQVPSTPPTSMPVTSGSQQPIIIQQPSSPGISSKTLMIGGGIAAAAVAGYFLLKGRGTKGRGRRR
jgi:hypothetical protein